MPVYIETSVLSVLELVLEVFCNAVELFSISCLVCNVVELVLYVFCNVVELVFKVFCNVVELVPGQWFSTNPPNWGKRCRILQDCLF